MKNSIKITIYAFFITIASAAAAKPPILLWDWSQVRIEDPQFLHTLKFPQGFEWGVADSAYQTEGALYYDGKMCKNNWTQWEQLPPAKPYEDIS